MPGSRRRGAELEEALLQAAWEELTESGYHALTLEAVAARAGTSRPVISRRWADKQQLVAAALARVMAAHRPEVPETGSLRGDLLELLTRLNDEAPRVMAMLSVQFAEYFQATGAGPDSLQGPWEDGVPPELMTVYRRAVEHGELPAANITPLTAALPVTVLRHEVLARRGRVPAGLVEQVVDDVVLPVLTRRSGEAEEPPRSQHSGDMSH